MNSAVIWILRRRDAIIDKRHAKESDKMFGRKKGNFFGNSIDPSCKYCANFLEFENESICKAGKKPQEEGACPHFSYDPLRRLPSSQPLLERHDPDEFKL